MIEFPETFPMARRRRKRGWEWVARDMLEGGLLELTRWGHGACQPVILALDLSLCVRVSETGSIACHDLFPKLCSGALACGKSTYEGLLNSLGLSLLREWSTETSMRSSHMHVQVTVGSEYHRVKNGGNHHCSSQDVEDVPLKVGMPALYQNRTTHRVNSALV